MFVRMFFLLVCVFLSISGQYSFAQKKAPPTQVFVADVTKQNFYDEIEALGTLRSNENVSLSSSVTELVTQINFEDGQRVNKGDVLVVMDSSSEQALKEEEQSRIDEAGRQVERLKPLVRTNASSKSLLDEAELELQTAQARLRELDTRISERTIVAPFDGVLGLRNISVGALLQPGTVITTIDDDSVMKLDFSVPEVFLGDLHSGLIVEATTGAYPDAIFNGRISSLNSRVDSVTRALRVRALLENTGFKLKPGLLMQIKLQRRPRESFVIPEEAISVRGDQKFVYTVFINDADSQVGTVKRTLVETGGRRKGYVEIIQGLSARDQIVVHGNLKIREGSEVIVSATETKNESLSELLQQRDEKGS